VFAPELARCVATREGNSQDYETTTMVAHAIQAGALRTNPSSGPDGVGVQADLAYTMEARAEVQAVCITGHVTHTLRADGFDASEDGTGRGTPIAFDPRQTDVPVTGDITGALDASFPGPAICFSSKDYGADAAYEISPTLRACGHTDSHANAGAPPAVTVAIRGRDGGATAELGGEVATALRASTGGSDKAHVLAAVAFAQNTRDELREMPIAGALSAQPGMKQTSYARVGSAVRRLTPVECERLQGFEDNYTLVPDYAKSGEVDEDVVAYMLHGNPGMTVEDARRFASHPDGPRYKALGNSMAVPCMRWIGQRIALHMPAANDNEAARHAAEAA
jgi:DNA (cytosine-5)-methyltransferase 1